MPATVEKPKTKTKGKAAATPPNYSLDDLVAAAGSMLLDTPDAEMLLRPDAASLVAADRPDETHPSLARVSDDSSGVMRAGVPLGRLASVITERGINYELSPIAIGMIEFGMADFLDVFTGEMLEARQVQELLNIPVDRIVSELRTDRDIAPVQLQQWIDAVAMPYQLSIGCVAQIWKRRQMRSAIEAERRREADEPPSLADLTSSALQAHERQEQDQRERERQQRLATYRSLLARRNEPNQQDAERLAYLASELGFDTEQIREHVKLLDKHDMLIKMHSELDDAERDERELAAQVAKLGETVRMLQDLEREHGRSQSCVRSSRRAEREARRLRSQHPDLFAKDES